MRPWKLGNPTTKAWLAGWDAALIGRFNNPYTRRPQHDAWARGYKAGIRSNDDDVAIMQRMVAKRREAA